MLFALSYAGRRTPEGYDILEYEELLKCADVVSFHTALAPDTHHLLDARCISLMKDSAVVVNTSRGAVIDTLALAEALQADKLWGAGIDVFEGEPVDPDRPLMKAPHTVFSPHVAYWSEDPGHRAAYACHAGRNRCGYGCASEGLPES